MICGFFNDYRWLSNFWQCKITYEGLTYSSVENAYQAAKTVIQEERLPFLNVHAVRAKRLGKKLTLRPDWENVKLDVMLDLLRLKFAHEELKKKLLDTGEEYLEETNNWYDFYWGVCNGNGENHLGRLLMQVREELKNEL